MRTGEPRWYRSGKIIDDLEAGARVAVRDEKKDPPSRAPTPREINSRARVC